MLDQALFIVFLVEGGFAKCRVLEHRRIPAMAALPGFSLIGQFEIAVGARQYVDANRVCKTVLSLISLTQIKLFSYQLSI
jgi:hypothetical protein